MISARGWFGVLGTFCLFGLTVPSQAQMPAVGDELHLNAFTTSLQLVPEVVTRDDGGFIVVWHSLGSPGDDDDSLSIQAQIFDAEGGPQGSQFQVNTTTSALQRNPAVASFEDGGFVIAWTSTDNYSGHYDLRLRRYTSSGSPIEGEVIVDDTSEDSKIWVRTASAADGRFVVVWLDDRQSLPTNDVRAQRFDSSGSPVGASELVETSFSLQTKGFEVDMNDVGDFVIVWERDYPAPGEIHAMVFPSSGPPNVGFQVNSYTTGFKYHPAVTWTESGIFFAWGHLDAPEDPTPKIRGRVFDGPDLPVGSDFVLSRDVPSGSRVRPRIVASRFDALAVWESSAADGSGEGIRGRALDASGNMLGEEFLINSSTPGIQAWPALASTPSGQFVVVWHSDGSDLSSYGIVGQRLAAVIFADGFESGDTTAW